MPFKRVLQGKPPLKRVPCEPCEPCEPGKPPCDVCETSNFLEEIMRVIILSLLLWAGITYGSAIMPYSLNFIISSDSMYPPRLYDYPFPSPQVLTKLPVVKDKDLNESLRFGRASVDALKRLEENLKNAGVVVTKGSPEHGQLIDNYPSDDALILQQLSSTITKASRHLSHLYCGRFGISDDECASYVSMLSLQNTDVGKKCTLFSHPRCSVRKYRTYDGSCNNPKRGSWGQALTGFKRLLHPKYSDGIELPRVSSSKKPLPPARMISASIASDINVPDSKNTLATMQWSQFLEHDLVHIPIRKMIHSENSINCCDQYGNALSPRHKHPSCDAMTVAKSDPFYGPRWINCLSYTKSVTTFRSDCTFGAAEQMNQATHFLDGSQIYGSNSKESNMLRENKKGLLKVTSLNSGTFLPLVLSPNSNDKCQVDSDDDLCFKSGDSRVNSQPQLTSMHTLWIREHNRIAYKLSELNPTWSDEILYQETRRIVIAEMQHITFNDWFPNLISKSSYNKFEMYDTGYNTDLDPSISNSFGTVGLRFFNSLLDGTVNLLNEDRTVNTSLELVEHFNRPDIITQPDKYDQLIRGMITQPSQSMDLHIADDINQQLYSPKNKKLGLDILSFDIQRGRDHGLPPYNQYRVMCGLKYANNFDDLSDSISKSTISQLKKLYNDVQDIDLIVGALAEQAKDESVLGSTFSCLLGEQLTRTRSSDKYFYTNLEQPEPFTQQQLTQIKKVSLARIICDNVPEIKKVQKDVFTVISDRNELLSCEGNDIKRVNLAAWQDPSHKPDLLTRTKMNVDKWIKNNARF